MKTLTKKYTTKDDDLYMHYQGQSKQQDAYLQLNISDGTLYCDVNGEIGNNVPFSVFHQIELRWAIPSLRVDAVRALIDDVANDAQAILNDSDTGWDGSNWVGVLGEDATEAVERIESLCESRFATAHINPEDIYEIYDAGMWLEPVSLSDIDLSAASTDEEIAIAARELVNEAKADGVELDADDIEKELVSWRDAALEDLEENE